MIAIALMLSLAASPEPNEQAASRFRDGEAAFARGDSRAAAEAFEEAYRLAPHAAALYNAGVAWQLASEPARAADLLELALSLHQLAPAQERDAANRLSSLNALLGTLVVRAEAGTLLSVAHLTRQSVPARVHLPPGHHTLTLESPSGAEKMVQIDLLAGRVRELTVSAEGIASAAAPIEAVIAPPPAVEKEWSGRTVAGVGFGIATVVGVAASAVLGSIAVSTASDFQRGGSLDAGLHDQAVSLRAGSNVAWGITVALAITAALLFFLK